jgi:hypothetical protein
LKRLAPTLLACAFWAAALVAAPQELDAARYAAHLKALTADAHRLAGAPEAARAGDYIATQLQALKGQFFAQRFTFPQQIVDRCELRLASGAVVPLEPLAANGVQLCVTPAEGLRGRLLYLGKATEADLAGIDLTDTIAVVDLDARNTIAELFRLGVKAVIFVGVDPVDRVHAVAKRSYVSFDAPRFYLSREAAGKAGLLERGAPPAAGAVESAARLLTPPPTATLISRAHWEKRPGRNLFLWLPGSDPKFPKNKQEEYILLSAWYDSSGLVPTNSPCEEPAANCAALLETARLLAGKPPRRSVLVAFFDNHNNYMDGGRQFYAALRRSIPEGIPDPLAVRLRFVAEERAYLKDLAAFLDQPDLFKASGSDLKDEVFFRMAGEARFQYDDRLQRLADMRLKRDRLKAEKLGVAEIEARILQVQAEQRAWQAVRECIRDRRPPDLPKDARKLAAKARPTAEESAALDKARRLLDLMKVNFQAAVKTLQDSIADRQRELDEIETHLKDAVALTDTFRKGAPVLHASYRFTAGGERWVLSPRGTVHAKFFGACLNQVAAKAGKDKAALNFVWESRATWESGSGTANVYNPLATYEESFLAEAFEVPALELLTDQDRATRWGMPDARFTPAELDRVRAQASRFLPFLDYFGSDDNASAKNNITLDRKPLIEEYQWNNGAHEADGHRVKSFPYGQTSAIRSEPYCLVHVTNNSKPAEFPDYYLYTDGNGYFPLTPVNRSFRQFNVEAARFDADGRIVMISASVPRLAVASVQTGWDKSNFIAPKAITGWYGISTMFNGRQGQVVGRTLPFGDSFQQSSFTLLNGLANSVYPRVHFRFDPAMGAGVYFIERPLGVKLVYRDPRRQDEVALYINPQDKAPMGVGYPPGIQGNTDAPLHTLDLRTALAGDMYRLNEVRLESLRRKNIILNFYEDLHVRTNALLDRFRDEKAHWRHGAAEVAAGTAAAFERRVYVPIMQTMNDMIVAVTVLLILTLPFAFSLQNLLLSTYNIYKKILGFIAFFIPSFIILYLTHPAFSFAATPIIIFLAFFIIVMSGVVIYIISGKFFYEVKKLQGLAAAAHTFEKSFFGHLGSAVALAFSTMRRRPVRTALTIVTVLLLTFTILSFAAFQAERGINEFYRGSAEGDPNSRMLVHRKVWRALDNATLTDTRAFLDRRFDCHGIYWRVYELTEQATTEELRIPVRAGERTVMASAVMSLDALELRNAPALRDVLPARADDFNAGRGVYLSEVLSAELKLKPGDPLRIDGLDLVYLGAFNSRALLTARHLDGSPMLPINFAMTKLAIGGFERKGSAQGATNPLEDLENDLAALGAEALEPVSPDSVIIAPTALAEPLAMKLRGLMVYPARDGLDLVKTAQDLAILNDDGVYLNKGGETTFFLYGDRVGVSGARDIILPLILGGLIVFSTLLGSVIDREKEIYTFSALGLAPRNIAMLFFVEAGIYAVIGGFGGYMLGQVVTRVMEILASYGLFRAPEMNYSSSTAITTILIVMATVIVSTIYPALQAANKATAETARRWKIPAPKGDVLAFDFPFTISRYDITGIICFIREHFNNHADRTVGAFAADNVALVREDAHGMASLHATIWLQPFDQGISQKFEITARPSDIPEVCDVHLHIERLSGPPAAWRRSNTLFLEDMRSQFLLWRTLAADVREHYLTLAESVEADMGILQPDPDAAKTIEDEKTDARR